MAGSNNLTTSINQGDIVDGSEVQETRPSKLDEIRLGLESDSRLYVAGEVHAYHSSGMWTDMVDIIVAPVNPIFGPDELNEFMDSLLPGIERSSRDGASVYMETGIHLGRLYFDEKLGETKVITTKTTTSTGEPGVLEKAGIPLGERVEETTEVHRRRTWVRVYPDTHSAQLVAQYEMGVQDGTIEPNQEYEYLKHSITGKQLENIRKSRVRPGGTRLLK